MQSQELRHRAHVAKVKAQAGIPLPVTALAIGLLVNYVPLLAPGGFGAGLSYLGWIVPLVASGFFLATSRRKTTFPYGIWVPWMAWVTVYALFSTSSNAVQRSVMLLTPLVIGAAFSNLLLDEDLLQRCGRWIAKFFWIFIIAAGISTGILTSQGLYATTGFAAGSITASLLAAYFAVSYSGSMRYWDLFRWFLLASVPILANTRTGMIAVAITLPMVVAPWPLFKRVLMVCVLAAAGLAVFQTERIQSKMFYSGHGTLSDAVTGLTSLLSGDQQDLDFATSGRLAMKLALAPGIEQAYWFGHGANTTEPITIAVADITHPHNDWLRLQYEYGTAGMLLFAFTWLAQAMHMLVKMHRTPRAPSFFLYVGATAIIPMILFMFSDNVIMYAAWFGNLHFAIIGLGYATATQYRRTTNKAVSH